MIDNHATDNVGPSEASSSVSQGSTEMQRGGAVVSSTNRHHPPWAQLTSCDEPLKPEGQSRPYAPILVSCSGSDDGDSSSDKGQGDAPLLKLNNSITSTLDGMDSFASSREPTPAQIISEQQVQAGCFKTGVRYCLETWPNNFILQVGFYHRSWLDPSKLTAHVSPGSGQCSEGMHQLQVAPGTTGQHAVHAQLHRHTELPWASTVAVWASRAT